MARFNNADEIQFYRDNLKSESENNLDTEIVVGLGTCGIASGARDTLEAIKKELEWKNIKDIKISQTGCMGYCVGEPLVEIRQGDSRILYENIKDFKVEELLQQHLIDGNIVERWQVDQDLDFFKAQERIVLKNCGLIDPESIDDAISSGAYRGLAKAIKEMDQEDIVNEITVSKLRGRGGGGFPTGMKWKFALDSPGEKKYIVCNADEGDPGAFMDRSILEGDPHRLIEGMIIAGYAIGANYGYVYCRAEYPLAISRLRKAIKDAEDYGILGENILGSGFDFNLDIRLGAGAFVCGEETALLASLEGHRGEPKPRPPYPPQKGYKGYPTVINNVETLANIPDIIDKGRHWFKSIGTEDSPGTKVFALAGKVRNNGLVEVPMGTKLGDIVFDIGGGLINDGKFKAAQTGGPSGGCIPIEHLNVPIDYDSLKELGTIMGSGGLIVMDQQDCMVDLAKYFIDFCKDESCGKCTPCRIGTTRMLEILDKITKGEGEQKDLDLLLDMGEKVQDSSFCGLGQTAPNPVVSTARYFMDEYKAHIEDNYCESSRCASMFDSPCQNSCPANVDVPKYIDLVRQGRYKDAYKEIQRENPLVLVCGRVCYNLCEPSCNRRSLDEGLAIRELKRFVSDIVPKIEGGYPIPKIKEDKNEQVAVIGSGPAGLTAAFYLRKQGYQVKIFESNSVLGGLLAVGIPEFRLPQDKLNEEITVLTTMGVDVEIESELGRDFSFDELKKQGYKAVYLALGTHNDLDIGIEGEELDGVYNAIELLKKINLEKGIDMDGKKIAVVGGGNAAIDVARNAVRMGADEVNIVYRRREEEMPAHGEEVEEAKYEKVNMHTQVNPVRIDGEDGKVVGLECVQIEEGDFDQSGRRRPQAIEGSNFMLDVDIVVMAIGQNVDDKFNAGNIKIKMTDNNMIEVNENKQTNIPWIFAGGDCITGPSTVVESVKQGKDVAREIDIYLGGDGDIISPSEIERELSGEIKEEEKPQVKMPKILLSQRIKSFKEIEKGYSEEQAQEEAARCLRCDVEIK